MNRPEILDYFAWQHLPPHLAEISRPFAEMADKLAASPVGIREDLAIGNALLTFADKLAAQAASEGWRESEAQAGVGKLHALASNWRAARKEEGLRLLLEAKDCAVRAALKRKEA